MKIVLKTFCSALGLVLGLTTFTAKAQDVSAETSKPRAILFKIHDIKPVMNNDGMVTDCDFLLTVYNRTTETLRDAKLNLGWNDEVTSKYSFDNETENKKVQKPQRNAPFLQGKTSEISTNITLPALGSYKQATVKGSVKTEKCFLLLDTLNFDVESCDINTNQENANNNQRATRMNNRPNNACTNLFEYVDSKNPEYYNEFQKISYSEQERLLEGVKKQDTTEIQKAYDSVSENLGKAIENMDKIK